MFMNKYTMRNDCRVEEFVEGTMINLFYDEDVDKWEIASKTTVGANVTFFKDSPSFNELFYEICNELAIDFNNFSKDYCYSFVMQHPNNKFVIPIVFKRLYLIAAYKICQDSVVEVPRVNLRAIMDFKNISIPQQFTFNLYQDLINAYGTLNVNYDVMGVVIRHKNGGRSKIRNPNYEYIKQIRGNNSKLQFQYLSLRKQGIVKEYLRYFPENKQQFMLYRKQLYEYTENLHTNYVTCFIKKQKGLKEFSPQFKSHMFSLHKYYLTIRENKGYINKNIVINYINNLHPAQIMYVLNYNMREVSKIFDTTTVEKEMDTD